VAYHAKDRFETAAGEGFVSVEHLKRYTTTSMAIDQGKTANVNALAILGELTGFLMPSLYHWDFMTPGVSD
jgi:sarcosine oxidase subunit alpha